MPTNESRCAICGDELTDTDRDIAERFGRVRPVEHPGHYLRICAACWRCPVCGLRNTVRRVDDERHAEIGASIECVECSRDDGWLGGCGATWRTWQRFDRDVQRYHVRRALRVLGRCAELPLLCSGPGDT